MWSLSAGILLNALLLIILQVAYEISSVDRMMDRLSKEWRDYRIVLLVPKVPHQEMKEGPAPQPRRPTAPKPLAAPDPRILKRLDPRLADFVRENPAIENILTREIVRDIDNKVLVLDRLLEKSSIRVSFQVNENGSITGRRVERSSRVPSIDHLVLEMITLLEKHQFLAPLKGLRRVVASIAVDEQIEIRFQGEASDEQAAEEIRKQLQNVLVLLRIAMGKEEAAFVLDDISLLARQRQVVVSKAFEKQPLIDFLMQYYQPQSPPPPAPPPTPPGQ